MNNVEFTEVVLIAMFIGIAGGLFMVAHSDGIEYEFYKRMRCKFNLHKFKVRLNGYVAQKYYCQFCKQKRAHPKLEMVDGGKKWMNNRYKF